MAVATVVASLLAGPIVLVIGIIGTILTVGHSPFGPVTLASAPNFIVGVLLYSLFGAIIATPTLVLIGLPAFYWLRRRNLLRWQYFVGLGALAGWFVAFILYGVRAVTNPIGALVAPILLGAVPGTLVSLTWWWIVFGKSRN